MSLVVVDDDDDDDDDIAEAREEARFDFFAGVSGLRRFAALVMAAATAAMRRVYDTQLSRDT